MNKEQIELLATILCDQGFDYVSGGPIYRYQLVGSRVTCDPAPTDTDQDVLLLCDPKRIDAFFGHLFNNNWGFDGSDPGNWDSVGAEDRFQSFTKGSYNLIVTSSDVFYKRFSAATAVAKHLNLLRKEDRIILFQAVLYGTDATRMIEGIRDAHDIEEPA